MVITMFQCNHHICILFVFLTRLYQFLTQPSIKPKESESQAVGPGTARRKQQPNLYEDQEPSKYKSSAPPEDQAYSKLL